MHPPVHQLEYFVAVAETGQFTRAADRVHVAQPSVSAQVRQLERALGTALFHRGPGPVTLTEAGEALLPLARRVLADLADMATTVAELDGLQRGHVAIGATPSISTALVPTILRSFHDRHPKVTIAVSEQGSQRLVEGLESGALHLALAILPIGRSTLACTPLADEDLVVVRSRRKSRHLVRRGEREVALKALRGIPMVMFRAGYELRTATLRACADAGFEPTIAVEGGELSGVLSLVAEGLGVAIVPSMVATGPDLVRLPLRAPALTRRIGLVRPADRELSRAAGALADTVTSLVCDARWPGPVPVGLRLLRHRR
ncbi:MAG TPA: LysR substrate-binding domain-containing protein [Acidimicrobiales bacterium]|nr:LysR substrate-binding domain-containing protein [Acidimicrobiales bacterium]